MRWLDGITDLMDLSLSRLLELVLDREACRLGVGSAHRLALDTGASRFKSPPFPFPAG